MTIKEHGQEIMDNLSTFSGWEELPDWTVKMMVKSYRIQFSGINNGVQVHYKVNISEDPKEVATSIAEGTRPPIAFLNPAHEIEYLQYIKKLPRKKRRPLEREWKERLEYNIKTFNLNKYDSYGKDGIGIIEEQHQES